MKRRVGRIEGGETRTAEVIPPDIVQGAVRSAAEGIGIKGGLQQIFDGGVAWHTVIDDSPTVDAQFLLEFFWPGLTIAQRQVVGRAAAERRHDLLRRQLRHAPVPASGAGARMRNGVAIKDTLDRRRWLPLQEGVPAKIVRWIDLKGHHRNVAETGALQRERARAEAEIQGRQGERDRGKAG